MSIRSPHRSATDAARSQARSGCCDSRSYCAELSQELVGPLNVLLNRPGTFLPVQIGNRICRHATENATDCLRDGLVVVVAVLLDAGGGRASCGLFHGVRPTVAGSSDLPVAPLGRTPSIRCPWLQSWPSRPDIMHVEPNGGLFLATSPSDGPRTLYVVGKGEAGVGQPLPPRCRSGVSSPHLPACGSRTGRPQPKLPHYEESRGVLDHNDRGTYRTLPGSATQVGGRRTPRAACDCRCSSSA